MSDPAALTRQRQARVFFALWPDAPVRDELARTAAVLHAVRGGRRTRPEAMHLTLVFVGAVARERLPELQAAAGEIGSPPFEIVFDRARCWRHNRIAFLTAGEPPQKLAALVSALQEALERSAIAYDRRPFVPHVTLLRDADCRRDDPPIRPIRWRVTEFVLVESVLGPQGAHYPVLGRYPLRGDWARAGGCTLASPHR